MRRHSIRCAGTRDSAAGHWPERTHDPATPPLSGYLGSGEVFDRALAEFSVAYADQTEKHYAAFMEAIETGRIPAHE